MGQFFPAQSTPTRALQCITRNSVEGIAFAAQGGRVVITIIGSDGVGMAVALTEDEIDQAGHQFADAVFTATKQEVLDLSDITVKPQ